MVDIEVLRKNVGYEAADYIKDGQVVGLGTGGTIKYFIERLGKRIENGDLIGIKVITTSESSRTRAKKFNIPITYLRNHDIDIAVDGADEVDPHFNLIKGHGGALTKEKIVDYNAKEFLVIVDENKLVKKLGEKKSVPLEIIPKAFRVVKNQIKKMGEDKGREVKFKMKRDTYANGDPVKDEYGNEMCFKTDNGNYILNVEFDKIEDPQELEKELNTILGVVENGIFSGTKVNEVMVGEMIGEEAKVRFIKRE